MRVLHSQVSSIMAWYGTTFRSPWGGSDVKIRVGVVSAGLSGRRGELCWRKCQESLPSHVYVPFDSSVDSPPKPRAGGGAAAVANAAFYGQEQPPSPATKGKLWADRVKAGNQPLSSHARHHRRPSFMLPSPGSAN